MRNLDCLAPIGDCSGAWCDDDAVRSAAMEAVSFVTPVLERFFIHTVARVLAVHPEHRRDAAVRNFIHEEAEHSRAHGKLNRVLIDYLHALPPGLATVEALLKLADRRLPLARRLVLVAALEHFATVLSKNYLRWEKQGEVRSPYARTLFSAHAQEEIGHRSVVFDLLAAEQAGTRIGRLLAITAILVAGTAYVAVAVPWILHRKTGGRLTDTIAGLTAFLLRRHTLAAGGTLLKQLLLFAGRGFHPQRLVDEERPTAAIQDR